ncbi:MAG: hypothetical protein QG610_2259, partial [Euryarchaeota archaeon]|nr:hypothetical protein [Euryarchaeota archaeon]
IKNCPIAKYVFIRKNSEPEKNLTINILLIASLQDKE